jgi:uncharacterized protein (TIGR02118 family)
MVRLVSLLKRKEGTTHEEFLAHWRDRHGPLIAASSAARYVRRYEQHPVVWPPAGSREPEPPFDGVTIQEFDSVESFHAHLAEPDAPAMLDDVARFLDPSALQWVICDEPTVVIDRS